MIHIFVFQVMKMAVSFIGHKTHLELVGWHNNEKLMLMGTPGQALLPALIFSVLLVVPVAALTYRWIEKPAMDLARHGLSGTSVGSIPRLSARTLVRSVRRSLEHSVDIVRAISGHRAH